MKSATYHSNIYVDEKENIVKSWAFADTPMIDGTVMELAPDKIMEKVCHYYCKNVGFELK